MHDGKPLDCCTETACTLKGRQGKDGGLLGPLAALLSSPAVSLRSCVRAPTKPAPWVTEARREIFQEGFKFGVGHDG